MLAPSLWLQGKKRVGGAVERGALGKEFRKTRWKRAKETYFQFYNYVQDIAPSPEFPL